MERVADNPDIDVIYVVTPPAGRLDGPAESPPSKLKSRDRLSSRW